MSCLTDDSSSPVLKAWYKDGIQVTSNSSTWTLLSDGHLIVMANPHTRVVTDGQWVDEEENNVKDDNNINNRNYIINEVDNTNNINNRKKINQHISQNSGIDNKKANYILSSKYPRLIINTQLHRTNSEEIIKHIHDNSRRNEKNIRNNKNISNNNLNKRVNHIINNDNNIHNNYLNKHKHQARKSNNNKNITQQFKTNKKSNIDSNNNNSINNNSRINNNHATHSRRIIKTTNYKVTINNNNKHNNHNYNSHSNHNNYKNNTQTTNLNDTADNDSANAIITKITTTTLRNDGNIGNYKHQTKDRNKDKRDIKSKCKKHNAEENCQNKSDVQFNLHQRGSGKIYRTSQTGKRRHNNHINNKNLSTSHHYEIKIADAISEGNKNNATRNNHLINVASNEVKYKINNLISYNNNKISNRSSNNKNNHNNINNNTGRLKNGSNNKKNEKINDGVQHGVFYCNATYRDTGISFISSKVSMHVQELENRISFEWFHEEP
ncbi:hypothetical protein HELRODRAFT_167803 [Helobdella robusta]|uniref:Uncharacterized protein n=1 Tax=Helobdella robusta TaxID=6412 RepID=T1EZU0_HELRO|nr:hypothetical protein HELRODRAFT_167803 [Helobdella robusta]ESO09971.1 hypothetical protein HELRODRAFT_167803 [Helobdella robusta]